LVKGQARQVSKGGKKERDRMQSRVECRAGAEWRGVAGGYDVKDGRDGWKEDDDERRRREGGRERGTEKRREEKRKEKERREGARPKSQ